MGLDSCLLIGAHVVELYSPRKAPLMWDDLYLLNEAMMPGPVSDRTHDRHVQDFAWRRSRRRRHRRGYRRTSRPGRPAPVFRGEGHADPSHRNGGKASGRAGHRGEARDDSFKPAYQVTVVKDNRVFEVEVDAVTNAVIGSREDMDD